MARHGWFGWNERYVLKFFVMAHMGAIFFRFQRDIRFIRAPMWKSECVCKRFFCFCFFLRPTTFLVKLVTLVCLPQQPWFDWWKVCAVIVCSTRLGWCFLISLTIYEINLSTWAAKQNTKLHVLSVRVCASESEQNVPTADTEHVWWFSSIEKNRVSLLFLIYKYIFSSSVLWFRAKLLDSQQ